MTSTSKNYHMSPIINIFQTFLATRSVRMMTSSLTSVGEISQDSHHSVGFFDSACVGRREEKDGCSIRHFIIFYASLLENCYNFQFV